MELNRFVIFTSFIWFNFFMVITILLRKKREFYKYFSIHTLLTFVVLGILKLFVVFDFSSTFSIDSTHIMTTIQDILRHPVLSNTNIAFSFCIGHILIMFSLLGSIIFAYKSFYGSLKAYKFINSLPQTTNNDINKILLDVQRLTNFNRKIKIITHKRVESPAILGYFKPIIILPQLDFTYDEIRGIFIHEIMHCKYKHIILKLIIEFIKILFWWNPLVYLFSDEVIKSIDRLGRNYKDVIKQWQHITQEIEADIVVLDMKILDTTQHKDLIGTLISDIVLQLLSYVAESERINIKQRQAEGIAAAKARGVRFGRPQTFFADDYVELFKKYRRREISREQAKKL